MKGKGFILLEVMLSLVILGTVFVISIQAISSYVRSTSSSCKMNTATALSQQILAQLMSGELKTRTGPENLGGKHSDFFWEVRKNKISDIESQYKITIKWNEFGVEKDLIFTTSKLELKNRL